jgi:hypothetical protein
MIIPRLGIAVLSEMSDSELKTVRGYEGIDFNRVFKKKPDAPAHAASFQAPQHGVSFDKAYEKPKPRASNQTVGFEEAFAAMPAPEEIAEASAAAKDAGSSVAGGLLAAAPLLKGVKAQGKLDIEMNMSMDDVFTAVTGVNADLKGLGLQGNVQTKIQGNIQIEFR